MADYRGERTVVIQAPIQAVYAYVSDFPRHIEWNHQPTEMTKLTEGPVGVGSVFRTIEQTPSNMSGLMKIIFPLMGKVLGVAAYTEAEITALEPDRRVAWKAAAPLKKGGFIMKAEWEIVLEPQGEATQITQRFHYMPQGKISPNPESAALTTGEEVTRNLKRLKGIVEKQTAPKSVSSQPAIA